MAPICMAIIVLVHVQMAIMAIVVESVIYVMMHVPVAVVRHCARPVNLITIIDRAQHSVLKYVPVANLGMLVL